MPETPKNAVQHVDLTAQLPRLARTDGEREDLSDYDKEQIVSALASGQGLPAILREFPGMPGIGAYRRALKADPEFKAAVADARAIGAQVRIDEAIDYQFATRTDKALSIAASKYADIILKSAGLLAPKEFGPLIKLAGHDGGQLAIQIVSFKDVQIDGHATDVTPQAIEHNS